MPANLSPEYYQADKQFRQAKSHQEKLDALELMLSSIPKHKGTEKMQADLKRRIARFKAQGQARKSSGHHVDPFAISSGGAGQVILMGTPNAGKSALVAALTNAPVKVADYPFSTHTAVPGMCPFEDVQIQLVDMPPVTSDGAQPGMMGAYRQADIICLILDLSSDPLGPFDLCCKLLQERRMRLTGDRGLPTGPVTEVPEEGQSKKCFLLCTKLDQPSAADNLEAFRELAEISLPLHAVSTVSGEGLEQVGRLFFDMLNVVRVYSKRPGRDADLKDPFVLPAGATVNDLAREVHRELAHTFKSARIWTAPGQQPPKGSAPEGAPPRRGVPYNGQHVQRDHVLADRDIIELHA